MAECVGEFFISQGLMIAQACAWRLAQYSCKKLNLEGTVTESVLREILAPGGVDEKLKQMSLKDLNTARNHLKQALTLLHGASPPLETTDSKGGSSHYPTSIPIRASKMAKEAYKEGSSAFGNDTLSVGERAAAAQIIMSAIGIWHFDDPDDVAKMWAEQIRQFSQSSKVKECIKVRLSTGFLAKAAVKLSTSKSKDFDQIINFIMDASRAISYFPFKGGRRALIQEFVEPDLVDAWKGMLQLSRHNYDITLETRSYDILALQHGTLLMSSMAQTLYLFRLGPRIAIDEMMGHFSALSYDSYRNVIWALKSTNEFYTFQNEKLDESAEPYIGPTPPTEMKRWRIANADKFVILGAEMEAGAKLDAALIYITEDPKNPKNWESIQLKDHIGGSKQIVSIAASYSKGCGLRVAVSCPKSIYQLSIDTNPPFNIKTSHRIIPTIFDALAMAVCVDEEDRLIVASWRNDVVVLDSKWKEIKQQIPDKTLQQPQGLTARDGQIYALLPNILRVYDYM